MVLFRGHYPKCMYNQLFLKLVNYDKKNYDKKKKKKMIIMVIKKKALTFNLNLAIYYWLANSSYEVSFIGTSTLTQRAKSPKIVWRSAFFVNLALKIYSAILSKIHYHRLLFRGFCLLGSNYLLHTENTNQ